MTKAEESVKKTIETRGLIPKGSAVILGLSAGPDSLCLLHILLGLKEKLGFELRALHVNHMLRGADADADESFARSFCEEQGIPLRVVKKDVMAMAKEQGLSTEDAGRRVRYEAFFRYAEELRKDGRPALIALAHNRNDQAETVLFRILRGTGTDGLSGIASKRTDESGYSVIRPLLNVSRREIEAYIEAKDLEPRRDLTNDEAVYTRNKIRLELIPFIEERFNPNVTETLSRLADVAREDKEYLHDQARRAYEEACTGEGRLDLRKLEAMMPALRSRVYMAALKDKGLTEDVTLKHLKAIDSLRYAMGHGCAYTELPGGYRVMRVRRELVFFAPGETNEPG
jgi:tRNA(Ile)-lysidine synthase